MPTTWYVSNGKLTHDYLPSETLDYMEQPYPHIAWRVSNGKLTHDYLPEDKTTNFEPVKQRRYITIYDKLSDVADFNTHGLAVLSPISCEITEELNGKYSLILEHPLDSDGKWKHIKEFNIIKAMEQLFCIVTVTEQRPGTITATADHIFYNLNDRGIFPKSFMASNSVQGILALGWNASVDYSTAEQKPRVFSFSSDIIQDSALESKSYAKFGSTSDGMSYADMVMGSGNVIDMSGGELYRDNFYFSINKRMENSNDNAFEMRVGKDLTGIKRTVDTSQMCTYFRAYYGADKTFGTWFAVSWADPSAVFFAPHGIVRSAVFNPTLPYGVTDEHPDKDRIYDQLVTEEALKFFRENCLPKITIEIDLEDINPNGDFAEFTNLPDYRVGNIGTVHDERLGISLRLKITKTVKDAIRGKTKSITVTDQFSGEIATSAFRTKDGAYFKTADGKKFTTKIGG